MVKSLEEELNVSLVRMRDVREPEADVRWGIINLRRAIEGLKKTRESQ